MQRLRRQIIRRYGRHIPLSIYRRVIPRSPIGFVYHAVSDGPLPHIRHLYPYKTAAAFEVDLRCIKDSFELVGHSELRASLAGQTRLRPQAAFLSFDDGLSECYAVIRPLLKKHRLPGLFFLTTDWIDNQALFYRSKISLCIERFAEMSGPEQAGWLCNHPQTASLSAGEFPGWLKNHQQSDEALLDAICDRLQIDVQGFLKEVQPFLNRAQIREMRAEGFAFGAHGRQHAKLNLLTPEQQAEEIVESCRRIAEITGDEQVPFAFPFSGAGVDRPMLAELRLRHPEVGLIFDTQKLRRDRAFIFQRIWVDRPVPGIPAARNIDYWLHQAYQHEAGS